MAKSHVATWRDPLTGRQRNARCRSKRERDLLQARMRDLAWKVRQGLLSPAELRAHDNRAVTVDEGLERFAAHLADRKTSDRTVHEIQLAVKRLARDLRWRLMRDLAAPGLDQWLRERTDLSPRQRNRYRRACMQLGRWASRPSVALLGWNVFEDVRTEPDASVTRPQRALTVAEVEGLRSSDRWPDYLLLLRTGLRWTEAARLSWQHVDLPGREIEVPQGYGKRKRQRACLLPIAPDLAELMEARPRVGAVPLLTRGAKPAAATWRKDRAAAGIEAETAEGTATLGSMRATFCSHLAAAGVRSDDIHRLRRDTKTLLEEVYVQRSHVLPRLLTAVTELSAWHERQARSRAAEA